MWVSGPAFKCLRTNPGTGGPPTETGDRPAGAYTSAAQRRTVTAGESIPPPSGGGRRLRINTSRRTKISISRTRERALAPDAPPTARVAHIAAARGACARGLVGLVGRSRRGGELS